MYACYMPCKNIFSSISASASISIPGGWLNSPLLPLTSEIDRSGRGWETCHGDANPPIFTHNERIFPSLDSWKGWDTFLSKESYLFIKSSSLMPFFLNWYLLIGFNGPIQFRVWILLGYFSKKRTMEIPSHLAHRRQGSAFPPGWIGCPKNPFQNHIQGDLKEISRNCSFQKRKSWVSKIY